MLRLPPAVAHGLWAGPTIKYSAFDYRSIMTPATHAAVAAVVASRFRSLGIALAASFALHFVLDAIYHFEAFYQLSVPGKWSYEYTMLALFGALAVLGAPAMMWMWRRSRLVFSFGCYAFLMCALPFEPHRVWRLVWAALLSGIWLVLSPTAQVRRWVICAFAAYLPDCLRTLSPLLGRLHQASHYRAEVELGDWVSLLGAGRWKIDVNARIFDPWYQIGYGLEILLEAAILFGSLYWVARKPDRQQDCLPHYWYCGRPKESRRRG